MTVLLLWCVAFYDHSVQCLAPQHVASVAECHIIGDHMAQVAKEAGGNAGTSASYQCLTIKK